MGLAWTQAHQQSYWQSGAEAPGPGRPALNAGVPPALRPAPRSQACTWQPECANSDGKLSGTVIRLSFSSG